MIAALEAFAAQEQEALNAQSLDEILAGFRTVADPVRVMPAMFAVMERWPDANLGAPGPLVHAIESLGIATFEPTLVASVQRQPGRLNVWMVNRILNSNLDEERRKRLLNVLLAVKDHPTASAATIAASQRFLAFQSRRQTA